MHKAVPIGPIAVGRAYDPSDLENAATEFPDLNFEIVHGGLAFLEETAWLLARFGNISVNMEIQNIIVERRPQQLRRHPARPVHDRRQRRSSTGCSGAPAARSATRSRVWRRSWSSSSRRRSSTTPGLFAPVTQITDENKRNMLSGTYARLHGLDLDAIKAAIADDEFSRGQDDPLPEPYSTISMADQVKQDRLASA